MLVGWLVSFISTLVLAGLGRYILRKVNYKSFGTKLSSAPELRTLKNLKMYIADYQLGNICLMPDLVSWPISKL